MIVTIFLITFVVIYLVYSTLWVQFSHFQLGNSDNQQIKVVQLTDLHGRTHFINGSISRMVNRLKPDYVLITGDVITRRGQLRKILKAFSRIDCPNLFFVPGNHERVVLEGVARRRRYTEQEYGELISSIQNCNITVLANSGFPSTKDEKKILIYGFDNSLYGNERLTLRTEELQSYDFVIMLAHSPSIIKSSLKNQIPFDLLLTGHTHGGQIRILGRTIGAYRNYHVGMLQMDKRRHFYINRGLGTVRLPFRWACPPEIAVFEIGM
ncbi:hypothetical protein A8709_17570 [Paenibacillus pectinilyticus]|uniref:Calcineurin-like phosphoesterase domain-containing protein n=1 Tax=Paenibacillus pectinilyticus TaxID=512399 RepID=A0A1C1A0H8_9BACL|nr:hypothetical protein A8709_17570 [Paenibacillus pectinilyticus]